jgi:hypothetical protein
MYERTYHKSVLKQSDTPKEPRHFPWKRALVAIGVISLLVGFVFLNRMPALQVNAVSVEGTSVADPEEVSLYVSKLLEGNMLYVFPKTSILLVSSPFIRKNIRADFPRFETVSVSKDSLHSLHVRVKEYDGTYLWCETEVHCFFMDTNGIVFAEAPYFSGSAYVKIYTQQGGEVPFNPVSSEELVMINTMIERLKAISIMPDEFHFLSDQQLSVSFSHNGNRSSIYFDPRGDVEESLETLYSGMRVETFGRLYHDSQKKLEYIDLRFSNKMVYKFD